MASLAQSRRFQAVSKQWAARIVAVAAFSGAGQAFAASTWVGGDYTSPGVSNISMANPANWTGGTPVSSATLDLIFPYSVSTPTATQNIANPLLVRSLDASGAYNFTFNGNTIRFANPTSNTLDAGGYTTFNTPFDFAGPTTYSGYTTLTNLLTGSGTMTLNSQQLILNPASNNTYSGAMILNGGYINILAGSNTALASSGFTLNGGQITSNGGNNRLAGSPTLALNSTTSISANVNFSNGGTQSFGTTAFTGNGSGQIALKGGTFNGNVSSSGGGNGSIYDNNNLPINLNGNAAVTGGSSLFFGGVGIDLGGATRTFNTASSTDTISAIAMTNGALIKTGAGKLTFAYGTSTFTAPIDLQAGTIETGCDHLNQGVTNNGLLRITYGPSNTVNGTITGSGSVEILNGTTYAVLNNYTGGTVLNGGNLTGSTATLHGIISATSGSLEINQPAGTGTLTAVFSGQGALIKTGLGRAVVGGTNAYIQGTNLYAGTLAVASDTALGSNGIFWAANLEAVGNRTLSNVLFGSLGVGNAGVVGSGNLTFTDATAKTTQATFVHSSTGTTTVPGKLTVLAGASLTVNAGSLVLGDPSAVNGFVSAIGSTISVSGAGSLKVQSANFISLPDVTLNGGALIVPNGYAIPLSAVLQGSGTVAGRIASANGSTINATGNLAIGDVAHPAGINLDGELYTKQYAVTLNDSNQGVLGSLTQLGNGPGIAGTLNASKGLIVNFGRNITGNGTINSTNTLATAIIMNGDVNGDSISDYINFTGYVKGVGTFNNVAFSGTYAPGLSPVLATVGSVIFTPSNVLDMEIGGLLRGSQFDGIDATGNLGLGGQLKLSLINAFTPGLGNQFNLFDGPMTGTFSSFNFAPLPSGLQWDTSLLYSQGIVQVVVPEPITIAAMVFAGALLRRRR